MSLFNPLPEEHAEQVSWQTQVPPTKSTTKAGDQITCKHQNETQKRQSKAIPAVWQELCARQEGSVGHLADYNHKNLQIASHIHEEVQEISRD